MKKIRRGIDLYKTAAGIEKKISGKNKADVLLKKSRKNESEQKTSKAAKFLLLLGKDEASKVLKNLNQEEIEEVISQIAATPLVDSVEARELLEEFGEKFSGIEVKRSRGGVDTAREFLSAAFGETKAAEILGMVVKESVPNPFEFLNDLNFTQLSILLRKESIFTVSLVLTYIDPLLASRVLESLPEQERVQVVLRLANMGKVSTEVIETVKKTLQDKFILIGRDDSEELDGRSSLANILRYMDISDENRLIEEIEYENPELAMQIKEKLYTMDTVLHMKDTDLQKILFEFSEQEIAKILKGQTREIQDKINGSLSSRRKLLVADEGDIMGLIPRTEADESVRMFLEKLRKKEEEGTITIIREKEEYI